MDDTKKSNQGYLHEIPPTANAERRRRGATFHSTLDGFQCIYGVRYYLYACHRLNEHGCLEISIIGKKDRKLMSARHQDNNIKGVLVETETKNLPSGKSGKRQVIASMKGSLFIDQFVYVLHARLEVNKKGEIYIGMLAFHDTHTGAKNADIPEVEYGQDMGDDVV